MICRHLLRLPIRHFSKTKSKLQAKEIVLKPDPGVLKELETAMKEMTSEDLPLITHNTENVLNVQSLTPGRAMHLIDTDFETFFKTREINHQNFLLLIKAAGEQRNRSLVLNAVRQMELLGLSAHQGVLANVIIGLAKCREFEEAKKTLESAMEKKGVSISLSSAGLFLAGKSHDFELTQNIWNRAIEVHHLRPNLELMTAMVSACLACHQIKRCWEIYDTHEKLKIEPDDVLLGLMIKVCAKSKSAEKAKLLWHQMRRLPNVRYTAHHYDSLILALASRDDYAAEALERYFEMKDKMIQPTRLTFIAVTEATAKLGDVASAYNAIVQMNSLQIVPNNQVFDGLLKTYAGALSKVNVPKELKELYIKDAWKLFDSVVEKHRDQVNSHMLNSLALVLINGDHLEEAEDSVLPLFDRMNIEKTGLTYQVFLKAFFDKRMMVRVGNLFDNLVKTNTELLTIESLNTCLDTFIRIRDTNRLIKSLDLFILKKRTPNWHLMRFLAQMSNLPDDVYSKLRRFKFGDVILKDKIRTYFPISDMDKDYVFDKEVDRGRLQRKPKRGEKSSKADVRNAIANAGPPYTI